jgi:type IV pilus assembly protein PilC
MRELAVFSRQFATLVASGMPMLRTLHTLEEQTQDDEIKRRSPGARRRRGGQHARAGDGAPPEVFDRLYRAMVRSGEESGRLGGTSLDRIAYQVEKDRRAAPPGKSA